MKKVILIMSMIATFAFMLPSCSSTSTKAADETSTVKIAYECPMKCEGDKTYDNPGKCPKCEMDLVKVEPSVE